MAEIRGIVSDAEPALRSHIASVAAQRAPTAAVAAETVPTIAPIADSDLDPQWRIEGYEYLVASEVFDGALVAHVETGAVIPARVSMEFDFVDTLAGVVSEHDPTRTTIFFEDGRYIGGPGSPFMHVSEDYWYLGPMTTNDGMFLRDRKALQALVTQAEPATRLRDSGRRHAVLHVDHGAHRIFFDGGHSTFVIPDPRVNFWASPSNRWSVVQVYREHSGKEEFILTYHITGGYLSTAVGNPPAWLLGDSVDGVARDGSLIVGDQAVRRGVLHLRRTHNPALLDDATETLHGRPTL